MLKRNKDIDKEGLNDLIHLSKNLVRIFYVIIIVGIVLGISFRWSIKSNIATFYWLYYCMAFLSTSKEICR